MSTFISRCFAVVAAAFLAAAAAAQPHEDGWLDQPLNSAAMYGLTFWWLDEPDKDGTVAMIHYRNVTTSGGTHYFEYGWGEVAVALHITNNAAGGCCPDTLEALVWPLDLVAVPPVVVVPEGGTAVIRLIRWTGH